MITVDKNTILVKVSISAKGYNSGATAYGEIFLPKDTDGIDDLRRHPYTFSELDGKHSETKAKFTLTEGTIDELLSDLEKKDNEYYESLLECSFQYIDLDYDDVEKLNEMIQEIQESLLKERQTIDNFKIEIKQI